MWRSVINTPFVWIPLLPYFLKPHAKIVSKYKKEHAHEWIDILGKGDYVIQEDDSEWSEKEHITDILEIDE